MDDKLHLTDEAYRQFTEYAAPIIDEWLNERNGMTVAMLDCCGQSGVSQEG